MLDLINQHVAKILLALDDGASILRISKRIGVSYGWTYHWVKKLEELNVIERGENGLQVNDAKLVEAFRGLARSVLKRRMTVEDAYLLPNFSGREYAYTKTDAVFIWTKGGYQIGRSQTSYPLFIQILEKDMETWERFFTLFGVDVSVQHRLEKGIHYVLFPCDAVRSEEVGNVSVIPLEDTVAWAQKYEINFQPALEMLDEMYKLGIDVKYSERQRL